MKVKLPIVWAPTLDTALFLRKTALIFMMLCMLAILCSRLANSVAIILAIPMLIFVFPMFSSVIIIVITRVNNKNIIDCGNIWFYGLSRISISGIMSIIMIVAILSVITLLSPIIQIGINLETGALINLIPLGFYTVCYGVYSSVVQSLEKTQK